MIRAPLSRPSLTLALTAAVASLVLGGVACVSSSLGAFDSGIPVGREVALEVVSAGTWATALVSTNDGRVFYAERNTGRVRAIQNGALVDAAVFDFDVNAVGDRGLMGLALHPDFSGNGRIYAFYALSGTAGDTFQNDSIIDYRIVYFTVDGVTATSGEILVFSIPASEAFIRLGGPIAFGPDGMLFAAIGDQVTGDAAQNPDSLLGKILRLTDDGMTPADNPTPNSPVYASGVSDPRGITFDIQTPNGYVSEQQIGPLGPADLPGGGNELNLLAPGANYGWPAVTGLANTAAEQAFVAANPAYREPILARANLLTRAFAGLAVNPSGRYGGTSASALFLADDGPDSLFQLTLTTDRTGVTSETFFSLAGLGLATDITFTPAGTLYIATQTGVLRAVPIR